ncbi:heme-degrading domain-containing protein [Pseudovibrio exalbescens]|uniref:heme-degrading domain-containing protein n=1 Tax=Pseudovibrio exalbescens TaxID=197461 RepID=UPI0023657087|nr:heme-degrading domain-containing protein [Pseudovibrio exalbescens]MDD7909849.1 heme-degrading domain-containing protein [Pseudovibrio exalbescens]
MSELLHTLLEQESRLQFTWFSHDRAWDLGCALKAAAEERGASVAIDITMNGLTLFSFVMSGARGDNLEWVRRKKHSVDRYHHSTWYLGNYYKAKGKSMYDDSGVDPKDFASHGGSFPLIIRDVGVVGSITVSGLPQEQDHQLIVDVLFEFLDEDEKALTD